MYTLSQIRTRVNALKRKYALELQIVRIHRIAEDFSLRWVRAVGDRQPLPETQPFIRLIADNGFRFHTFMNLHTYLERCRTNGDNPDCWGIIRSLYANHDLDRISCMVDKCHALPAPDPEDDHDGFAERRPLSTVSDLIYWMDRWIDRVLRPKAEPIASFASVASAAAPRQENAHQTSRPWRRRQQRNTPTQTHPSPYGRGAGGEGIKGKRGQQVRNRKTRPSRSSAGLPPAVGRELIFHRWFPRTGSAGGKAKADANWLQAPVG